MPILDSDILISFLRNNKKAVQYIKNLIEKKSILKTTIINVAELYSGVYRSSNVAREIRILEAFLESFEILGIDLKSAITYGQISADLHKRGTPVGVMDELIASIALHNKELLVTGNPQHFDQIPQLKHENWK